jgi:hypothetical protein
MAGFAGNDDVLALPFLINDVGMAGLTGIVAGEGYRPGCDLGDRSAAIVAVLPKTARDDGSAQDDERNQCDRHDDDEPDEVLCVLEHVRIPAPDVARLRTNCAMLLDTEFSSWER